MKQLKKRYGPYEGEYGHKFWSDLYEDGSKKNVLVHREIMSKHLGRLLTDEEVVHHKNENPRDNRLCNLQVMTRSDHSRHHARDPETVVMICIECKNATELRLCRVRHNQGAQRKAGPFCGKSCAGVWSQKKQTRDGTGPRRASQDHGTRARYRGGCRCDLCKKFNAERVKKYRAKVAERNTRRTQNAVT